MSPRFISYGPHSYFYCGGIINYIANIRHNLQRKLFTENVKKRVGEKNTGKEKENKTNITLSYGLEKKTETFHPNFLLIRIWMNKSAFSLVVSSQYPLLHCV